MMRFKSQEELGERARSYAGGGLAADEANREIWAAIAFMVGAEPHTGEDQEELPEVDEAAVIAEARRNARRGRGDQVAATGTIEQIEPRSDAPTSGDSRVVGRVQERERQGRVNVGDRQAAAQDVERAAQERGRRAGAAEATGDDPRGAERAGTERGEAEEDLSGFDKTNPRIAELEGENARLREELEARGAERGDVAQPGDLERGRVE